MTHKLFRTALTTTIALGSALASSVALAHPGHGLEGFSHWHSTDVLGFAAIAGIVVGVYWLKGRK